MIDNNALFKLSYGLFVLTAREGDKDNGCIVNTVTQITVDPLMITVAVNKSNYTHDMIMNTKELNVSVLSEDCAFEVFKHFGFQSGKDTDKFSNMTIKRADNGITYLPFMANAYISAKVCDTVDFPTHTLFVCEVTEAKILNDNKSMTYQYYFDNVKPKPENKEKKTGYVCKICGYVYEGDPLPEDFICPLCKHPASDFERIR